MKSLKLIAAAALLLTSLSASATVFTFSVVSAAQTRGSDYSYIPNYQFSIDDATATFIAGADSVEIDGVTTTGQRPALGSPGGDVTYAADYTFYTGNTASFGGGFDDGSADHSYYSDQLFSGTTAAPKFTPGDYKLFADPSDPTATATLTIAQAGAVPEPGAWTTTIAGFAAIGLSLRRRRARSAPVVAAALG